MTKRERTRRTYNVAKERVRLGTAQLAYAEMRLQYQKLRAAGCMAAAAKVRAAMRSVGGAIRHAQGRLDFARAKEQGEHPDNLYLCSGCNRYATVCVCPADVGPLGKRLPPLTRVTP